MNTLTSQFIFGSQKTFESDEDITVYLDTPGRGEYRTSPYISVFEDIVNEIGAYELELLTDEERNALCAFKHLDYGTRYVLIRLALRVPGWHATKSALRKYVSEVGEEALLKAAEEICKPVAQIFAEHPDGVKEEEEEVNMEVKAENNEVKMEDVEVIDLTEDSDDDDDEDIKPCTAPAPKLQSPLPRSSSSEQPEIATQGLSFFCQNEDHMSLDDALKRLSVDELKELVKECKLKPKSSNKEPLIRELKKHSRSQVDLHAYFQSPHKASTSTTQENRLRKMACEKLGSCLSVNPAFYLLLRRLDIIFYRSTSLPKSPFLNSFLSFFGKRKFPFYLYHRTVIWSSRDDYDLYEQALELLATVESLTDDSTVKSKDSRKTPRGTSMRFLTPAVTPARVAEQVDVTGTPSRSRSVTVDSVKMEIEEELLAKSEWVDISYTLSDAFKIEEDEEDLARKAAPEKRLEAQRVVEIYRRVIKAMWESCISNALTKAEEERQPSLERFEQGYVLTRLLMKVAGAFALLHKYEEELEVLELLLGQRFWRRGKRGKWYERRALVKAVHLERAINSKAKENAWPKDYLKSQKRQLWEETRQGLYEALEDVDTHLVYRRSLVKRLSAIEKKLKVAPEDHHSYTEEGYAAKDVYFFADRAERTSRFPNAGKSAWKGLDGSTCNVETRALQYYESEEGGCYKGFHAETCILTTIFVLLFFDVIFADVPGAFETRYQIAPLDLIEDSFYYARQEMIEARLTEIQDGKALEILEKNDIANREQETWCVGLSWDVCGKDELAEIVECMGADALMVICKLFCLDYAARASGAPDLIVWNYEMRKLKFVEVKGPGDRPQENQILWFDALIAAGLDVDLCRVVEKNTKNVNAEREKRVKRLKKEQEAKEKEKEKEKKKQTQGQRKRKKARVEELETEDEGMLDGDDDAEYRGPENVDESDSFRVQTRWKRGRGEDDDYEDEYESRGVLAVSQDKVASQEVSGRASDTEPVSPPRKKLKVG